MEASSSPGSGVAGLIEQIENAAHTTTIVLEREESQEQEEEGEENYVTNVDSLGDLRPGEVFDVVLDQSQLEYLEESTQNDDGLVEQSENDNETNADDEDDEEDEDAESESSSDEEMPKTFESASELCDNYLDHLNHMDHLDHLFRNCIVYLILSFAVSGLTEHCPIFHFPSVRPSSRPFITGVTSQLFLII